MVSQRQSIPLKSGSPQLAPVQKLKVVQNKIKKQTNKKNQNNFELEPEAVREEERDHRA